MLTKKSRSPRTQLPLPRHGEGLVVAPLTNSPPADGLACVRVEEEAGKVGVGVDAEEVFRVSLGNLVHAKKSRPLGRRLSSGLCTPDSKLRPMETLSERFAHALERQGLNPPALAEKIGVTRQTIYNIQNGTTKAEAIRAVTLYPLSAALGVRPEWLLFGKGPRDLKHSATTEGKPPEISGTASHSVMLDPDILHESLTLLFHDEGQAGAYTPRAETARLIELYRRVELAGGRLTKEQNDLFEAEIAERGQAKNGHTEQPPGWRAKRQR